MILKIYKLNTEYTNFDIYDLCCKIVFEKDDKTPFDENFFENSSKKIIYNALIDAA